MLPAPPVAFTWALRARVVIIPSMEPNSREAELPKTQAEFFLRAAEKVRTKFPDTPGVYLFQDQQGRVIYIGKAKNLKSRAAHYFLKAAADDDRTGPLTLEAYDI